MLKKTLNLQYKQFKNKTFFFQKLCFIKRTPSRAFFAYNFNIVWMFKYE